MTTLPSIAGYRIRRLASEDAPLLQDLWMRCTDFHELQEGEPTRDTAGMEDLAALPPGKAADDKFAFGISVHERLVGYADLVRDYPVPGEWSLGLLLVDPQVRSRGLGSRVYAALAGWAREQGADSVLIGVPEHNPGAARFWRRQGFEEMGRQEFTSSSGHVGRIRVMRHPLRAAIIPQSKEQHSEAP